ncbi:ankyrin repeat-containing protein [Chthonomonas calidirosea]|uniref:FOG: Ankyrin repeat n=1 Tax=Chthonomonas calidirosea (strain DSM 23976 / ICMP 18418 / T49) TaxID=1303518 RepID=S0EU23_CHTCT|nr:ankyrin repeat domain-containing protein [Chthonomonas calidirosea]CCW35135.1 FOG: Ankyrin repeat [Chthonomonas calidirosea T49]CEK20203.1 ankyrin repeat-containing protein [Chthonomonas calidirosea]CEK20849.1 ankyrin repeat-containing protein [Chthonomonas calidirosea]
MPHNRKAQRGVRRKVILWLFAALLFVGSFAGGEPLLARLYQLYNDRSLAVAIERGDNAMLLRLLNAGADPNFPLDYENPKPTPATYLKNALHGPLRAPRVPVTTPLMLAVIHKRPDMVEELLAHGAFVDARDEYRFTPLFMALSLHQHAIVRLLLVHGADPNAQNDLDIPPIAWAIEVGDSDDVPLLLSHGANPNALDMDGRPVLYLATLLKDKKSIQALLHYNAIPSLSFHGWTVLDLVRHRGDRELQQLFAPFLQTEKGAMFQG